MQPTRLVGYVRVSTDLQADGGVSLDAQRAKLTSYASALDLTLVDMIEDPGVSAKTLDRPGLTRALGLLEQGLADGLLVTKLDRLTRSVRDLGLLLERYFTSRYSLLSVSDAIDTRSAGGRLVLHVLCSVAQWEREATGERTRDALVQVRREGGRIGRDGLGWVRTEQRDAHGRRVVVEHPEERAVLARIHELRAAGLSLRALAARMTAEGHPTKRGGRWAPETVRLLLRGPSTPAPS